MGIEDEKEIIIFDNYDMTDISDFEYEENEKGSIFKK